MAAYFQLLHKQTGTSTAFNAIDEELCAHFNKPVHDTQYLAGWYDYIGFRAATGSSWQEIIANFERYIAKGETWATTLLDIAIYLSEHYDINNWTGR